MKKESLYSLIVAAIFGGILCDRYIGTSFPIFTIAFVCVSAIIFFMFIKKEKEDE